MAESRPKPILMVIFLLGDEKRSFIIDNWKKTGMGAFAQSYLSEFGYDVYSIERRILGRDCKFIIKELAGNPEFEDLRRNAYRNANGGILVFDTMNPASLKEIAFWLEEIWGPLSYHPYRRNEKLPLFIVGISIPSKNGMGICIFEEDVHQFIAQQSEKYDATLEYVPITQRIGPRIDEIFEILVKRDFELNSSEQ
jgi:GTPase SAR1 family protein